MRFAVHPFSSESERQISLLVSAEAFESRQLDIIIRCPEWRVQARPGYRVSDIATLTILWEILADSSSTLITRSADGRAHLSPMIFFRLSASNRYPKRQSKIGGAIFSTGYLHLMVLNDTWVFEAELVQNNSRLIVLVMMLFLFRSDHRWF